jgi:biotin carboxyl carrier protein
VWVDDREFKIQWKSLENGNYVLSLENEHFPVYLVKDGDVQYISIGGEFHRVESSTAVKGGMSGIDAAIGEDQDDVMAPMPGKIVKILVKEGDRVNKGDNAVILEAMKMETHVPSPQDGTISKINCAEGDQVNLGDLLIELNPDEDAE